MARPRTLRQWLKLIFGTAILSLVALTLVAFTADYAVLRVRIAANHQPYGTVTLQHYYAVQQKNGKTEFIFDPPAPATCVHSLFPHAGYSPCWYLSRHTEPRTDI
jgi:hypothetical protein